MSESLSPETTTLLAIRFDLPLKAQEALLAMLRTAEQNIIRLEDAAIVDKDAKGKIRLRQSKDLNPSQGAAAGGWYGAFIGILLGPLGIIAGGVLGGAVGGLFAKLRDIGIDDKHMKEMGERINPGEDLLFLLLQDIHQPEFCREMKRFDGVLFESTADEEFNNELTSCLAVEL